MTKRGETDDPIIHRIAEASGAPDLVQRLSDLAPTDLQSLLMRVYQERIRKGHVRNVMETYRENRYLGVSELDQREIVRFDGLFHSVVPLDVQAVELSPVSPLGVNGLLARISQNNVLTTIRNIEVVGDPTTALALECALRRQSLLKTNAKDATDVSLCTSQRLLRLQHFDRSMGYMQHFKCFGLCTAGRDTGHEDFEIRTLATHLGIWLRLIRRLNEDVFRADDITVSLSDMRIMERLVSHAGVSRAEAMRNTPNLDYRPFTSHAIDLPEQVEDATGLDETAIRKYAIGTPVALLAKMRACVIESLQRAFPEVAFCIKLDRVAGIGYYDDLCFHIHGTNLSGKRLLLSDGGFTGWTQKLLQSRKERLLATGFGADLFHKMFRRTATKP